MQASKQTKNTPKFMETDIKALQAAIASEVNRREFERCATNDGNIAPTGEFAEHQDLVHAFDPIDLGAYAPPPTTQVELPDAVITAESRALHLYHRLRGTPLGKYLDHPRVAGLLARARQRPGGATLGNVSTLMLRAIILRVPFFGKLALRSAHILATLRRLPERLADLETTQSHHIGDNNLRLNGLARQVQDQTNQGLYTQALSTQQNEQRLLARIRRLEQNLRELNARATPAHITSPRLPARSEENDLPPDLYVDFEAHFRGHPDQISQRLKAYLPRLRAHAAIIPGPVLDLGCGRGEWLRHLTQENIQCQGIDSNPSMVRLCTEQGLKAQVADALDFLTQQPAQSLAALTAFHLIEHLPLPVLVRLLDQARRVLKPGGLILFETPNPENLIVGACNFYIDPTHRNPLPPALTAFLLQARGYTQVEIERRHPADPALRLVSTDEGLATPLNNLLFGPQDYAVIGYVP